MDTQWVDAPTGPGRWWRRVGDSEPVLCDVTDGEGMNATPVNGIEVLYSTRPFAGVKWRRNVPAATDETTRLHRCAKCGDERSAVESCEGDCYPLCGPCHVELRHEDAAVWRARVDAAEDIARQWIDGAAEANKTISDLHAQLAAALRRRGTLHDVATLRIRVESLEVALRDACEWVGTRDDFIPRVINVLRGANVADERAERATRERDDAHAQLAAVTRERDVFRAQQAPLLDAHDALVAAARAAGWTGAGATGAELVAWVRRGAMTEAARIARAHVGKQGMRAPPPRWVDVAEVIAAEIEKRV